MFDVSSFLLRWIFLSNLCRNVGELQTLPMQKYVAEPSPLQYPLQQTFQKQETIWRDQCIRGILSYPPGTQRTMLLDSLREELVQMLNEKLQHDEAIIRHYRDAMTKSKQNQWFGEDNNSNRENMDPYRDADVDIVRGMKTGVVTQQEDDKNVPLSERPQGRLVINEYGSSSSFLDVATDIDSTDIDSRKIDTDTSNYNNERSDIGVSLTQKRQPPNLFQQQQSNIDPVGTYDTPTLSDLIEARRSLQLTRNYLPQLVSAVLKTPPAFDSQLSNSIQKLRSLILSRCLQDPGVGIELCWLLEAEVGRAWKTLFEHRQQTGRRLIVVLPAEKAVVLAQIGIEKREAFDLLQDAEQATAFGYTGGLEDVSFDTQRQPDIHGMYELQSHQHALLPSSLSLRRCSHFGDSMHLIDKLTKISSDLRYIPEQRRYTSLLESLHELNRRIRRRMVTRGDVSLDVEDNRSPYDWPHVEDISMDLIQHSIHLPLVPKTGTWPNGEKAVANAPSSTSPKDVEVVRVLNIIVPESRLLASRARCPFLVHVEVADTGLVAGDARLYAAGATNIGSTVRETLAMSTTVAQSATHGFGIRPVAIPSELLHSPRMNTGHEQKTPEGTVSASATSLDKDGLHLNDHSKYERKNISFPRGGSHTDSPYYDENGYMFDPFDAIRQHQYEQLHKVLQTRELDMSTPSRISNEFLPREPKLSLGQDLLDKIFGNEWNEKCREIRKSSPYGNVKGWRLASFILKAGEDIRQEAFVMQIISKLNQWFVEEIPPKHRPFMRPYTIMCVGADAGIVECLSNAKSVDEIKKKTDGFESLRNYFERAYGLPRRHSHGLSPHFQHNNDLVSNIAGTITFEKAQDNFLRSLVGYSLVCYILQVKDRHNANILMDRLGHIMHIDFGFVLGDTPKMGKVPIFSERAPFKLSADFWEVLGGWNFNSGGLGVKFCKMFEIAFACASSHAEEIAALTEAVMLSLDSNPRSARLTANGVRNRLRMRGPPGSRVQKMFIMDLVNAALTSWGTSTYDWLQRNMNGYQ